MMFKKLAVALAGSTYRSAVRCSVGAVMTAMALTAAVPMTVSANTGLVISSGGTSSNPQTILQTYDHRKNFVSRIRERFDLHNEVTISGQLTSGTGAFYRESDFDDMRIVIPAGKTLIWNATYTGTTATSSIGFVTVTGGGTFRMTGGTITGTGGGRALWFDDGFTGNIEISGAVINGNTTTGGALRIDGNSPVIIRDGADIAGRSGIWCGGANNPNRLITINGGTVRTNSGGTAISNANNTPITINGGTIDGQSGIAIELATESTGTVTINGGTVTSINSLVSAGTIQVLTTATVERLRITGGEVRNTSATTETAANRAPNAIRIAAGATVSITGGTIAATGNTPNGSRAIHNAAGGTVNIGDAGNPTIAANGENSYGIYNAADGTVTVSGGTQIQANGDGSVGIYNHAGGTVNHQLGFVHGNHNTGIANNGAGTVNIGSSTTAGSVSASSGTAIHNRAGGTVNILNGTVSAAVALGTVIRNSGAGRVIKTDGVIITAGGTAVLNEGTGIVLANAASYENIGSVINNGGGTVIAWNRSGTSAYDGLSTQHLEFDPPGANVYWTRRDGAHGVNVNNEFIPLAGATVHQAVDVTGKTDAQINAELQTAFSQANPYESVSVAGESKSVTIPIVMAIPVNVTVKWRAELTGNSSASLVSVSGSGTFEMVEGKIDNRGVGVGLHSTAGSAVSFKIIDGEIRSNGIALRSDGTGGVTMDGGLISSPNVETGTQRGTVSLNGTGSGALFHMLGGIIENTASGGIAVSSSSAHTVHIEIAGGLIRVRNNGVAIFRSAYLSSVNLINGTVFGYGTGLDFDYLVSVPAGFNWTAFASPGGLGIVWNPAGAGKFYDPGSSEDIAFFPTTNNAAAVWEQRNGVVGIGYKRGANEGFIPIDGVGLRGTLTVPENVTITPEGLISWDAVANADGYTVNVYKGSNATASLTLTGKTGTSYQITNADIADLSVGTDYRVTVTANGDGMAYSDSDESAKSTGNMHIYSVSLTVSDYGTGDNVSFNGILRTADGTFTVNALSGSTVQFTATPGTNRQVSITGDVTASGNITNITENKIISAVFSAMVGLQISGDPTLYTTVSAFETAINAALVSGDVTVTGTLSGVTDYLTLNNSNNRTITWNAEYAANVVVHAIAIEGNITFNLPTGGFVVNIGANGAAIDASYNTSVVIDGGTVQASPSGITLYNNARLQIKSGSVTSVNAVAVAARGNSAAYISGGTIAGSTGSVTINDDSKLYLWGSPVIVGGSIKKNTNSTAYYLGSANEALFKTSSGNHFTPNTDLFDLAAVTVTANGQPHDGDTVTHYDVIATLSNALDLTNATVTASEDSPTMNAANRTATFTENTDGTINPAIMVNGARIAGTNITVPNFITAAFGVNIHKVPLTGTATISNMTPRIGDVLTGSLAGGNNTGTLAYAWKADGAAVGTNAATYTVAVADLGKVITLEIASDVEIGTRTSEPTAAVLKKAAPNAPSAPTVASKTHNRVTLTPTAGYEYSMDGTDWQTGNEFTGLTANTPYTFYQRIAETADTEASVASPALNVTTEPTTGIASNDRNIPQSTPDVDAAVIPPVNVSAFEVSVGPNPVRRGDGGIVNIFITGKRVDNGTLTVFDGSGNAINKITIRDNVIGGNGGRRIVGNWDLKDAKGKIVPEGAYLLRGSVRTIDGRRERVSAVIGIR